MQNKESVCSTTGGQSPELTRRQQNIITTLHEEFEQGVSKGRGVDRLPTKELKCCIQSRHGLVNATEFGNLVRIAFPVKYVRYKNEPHYYGVKRKHSTLSSKTCEEQLGKHVKFSAVPDINKITSGGDANKSMERSKEESPCTANPVQINAVPSTKTHCYADAYKGEEKPELEAHNLATHLAQPEEKKTTESEVHNVCPGEVHVATPSVKFMNYEQETARNIKYLRFNHMNMHRSGSNLCQLSIPMLKSQEISDCPSGTKKLGSGSFGQVKLQLYQTHRVAVKYYKVTNSKLVFKEAMMMKLCSHPSIPSVYGVCIDSKPHSLVMQFFGYRPTSRSATLRDFIYSDKASMSDNGWLLFLKQLCEALIHMHSLQILHNDIKDDNILVIEDPQTKFKLPILTDFGKSRFFYDAKSYILTSAEKSIYYQRHKHIAPELVEGFGKQSIYSDIFAFGYVVKRICEAKAKSNAILQNIVDKCYKCIYYMNRMKLKQVVMLLEDS